MIIDKWIERAQVRSIGDELGALIVMQEQQYQGSHLGFE